MINKLCGEPGCDCLALPGKYFCQKHQEQSDKRRQKHLEERAKDFSSLNKAKRFYNYNDDPVWKKVRKDYLEKYNCCCICGSRKNLQVHHIKPIRYRPDLRYDYNNLQTLCRACHAAITRQEIRERRKTNRY